ncbi:MULTISPECIES: asparaginase [unclassified Lentimicrobium]|uniref:asparaginase n=1 Tax=unclassified Lentimicrobium TaxID=2677434 RepID=UPI001557A2C4|nr:MULTISPECIES: asparaginase [unclassified Lentimicrobium]NPD46125.1 asparaginase [Lentimicrobium sp. S6]NPD86475.1 asparaginase [Lentimicrobium sp. L6]
MENQASILVIYTGGTIGMFKDPSTGSLIPVDFNELHDHIPSLDLFNFKIDSYSFDPIIDSANMKPELWVKLGEVIEENYENYDGFVILHGSDTMSFTASALSFILENLNKPVIITGSQLPLGIPRTDGRENFITSLELAAAKDEETPIIPEVAIYFENQLFRGNRTYKFNAENFEAFKSVNYPPLAEVGVNIRYWKNNIRKPNFKKLKINRSLESGVLIIRLFPGISKCILHSMLNAEGLKAVVLETFGSGNAPTEDWFLNELKQAIDKGITIVNISQCRGGSVDMGKYETSSELKRIGLLNGKDMTTEAAITKLMVTLGKYSSKKEIAKRMEKDWRGEMTE